MNFTVGHIGLNVSDLDRSKEFYTSVFDLKTIHEVHQDGKDYAFLSDGEGLLITLWRQSDGAFSTSTPGLHHLALQVADADAVRHFEARLREKQVPLVHDGIVANDEGQDFGGIYFLDPDGIRLEVCAPSGLKGYEAPTPGVSACGFF